MDASIPISIHGPRVGADGITRIRFVQHFQFQSTAPVWGPTDLSAMSTKQLIFQSTAPVWGPTVHRPAIQSRRTISIHGPRVGADRSEQSLRADNLNFNPRPPCGGRLHAIIDGVTRLSNFNPRPPCGGRRHLTKICKHRVVISIHGPRVGADLASWARRWRWPNFNPRPPCGGRPLSLCLCWRSC